MTERASWDEILDIGESAVDDFPYSLDLQRTISHALGELGHTLARDVVHGEAAALARRLPALLTGKDAEGNRYADSKTVAWLGGSPPAAGEAPDPGSEPPDSTPATPAVDPLADLVARARTVASEDSLLSALELLQAFARATTDEATRMRARLELTELTVQLGPPRLSLVLTRALITDLERHDLERWDPALAARALALAVRARNVALAMDYPPDLPDELLTRLARLDPAAALRSLL